MTTTDGIIAFRTDDLAETDETLVLLNGGFMSISAWQPIAEPLAERYRLVRCDFRGQLLSPGPAHPELGGNVDDVVALLDHLGIERAHVLGTSFGGEVGLLLAARHPERMTSLVAVTVTDHVTEPMQANGHDFRRVVDEVLAGADRGRFHDWLVDAVYSSAYTEANRGVLAERRRQISALPDAWFTGARGLLAAVARFDLRDELGAIRCPTLVVVAGDDRVMPPERGRAVAAAIPDARLAEHPSSGHVLVAEHPEWLVERTLAFLEELGA